MQDAWKNNLVMDASHLLSTMNMFHNSKGSYAEAEREHTAKVDANARRAVRWGSGSGSRVHAALRVSDVDV